ncbi:hypothetical protein [Corallococcus llansteffanensis]|uniref:Uncharacterized protein n=1 Tax=Corallococcus llansteffanensis TaxID=2316731 RepID=A0A3A8N9Z1_9BACT|nr:hypothetical protein [Corallococcus llansteffanensis]RKH40753.1 hypothetical protein D7V93_39300 [Corallococcus llansteffanensis]
MYTHAVLVPFTPDPTDEGQQEVVSLAKGLLERIRAHPTKLKNQTRRVYKKVLRLGDEREGLDLKQVPFDSTHSTLYVTAHGNPDVIGTRGPISISPERLARKLAEAGMPKTITDLKVMTCNSGWGWRKYGYLGSANTAHLLEDEPQGTSTTTVDEEPGPQEAASQFTIHIPESGTSQVPEMKLEATSVPVPDEQQPDGEVVPDAEEEDPMKRPGKPRSLTFYVRRLCIALYERGYTHLRVHGYIGYTGEAKKKGHHSFVTAKLGSSQMIRASLSRVTVQGQFGWTIQEPRERIKVK